MGATRYQRPYRAVAEASDRAAAIRALSDEEVVQALAGASIARDALLANVLATEATNRIRRSRAITTHLAEGAFAIDAAGRFTFVNPAMAQLLGADPWSAYVGMPLAEMVEISTEAPAADPLGAALREGRTSAFEGEIRRLGRAGIPASFIAAPIVREDVVDGAVVAFRDARESRRAREELERSERRYRSLFDNTPAGIVTIDLEGVILQVNPAGVRITAREPAEAIGKPFVSFVDERDHEAVIELFALVVRGQPQRTELRLIHKEGHLLRCDATGIPIVVNGEVIGVHGVFREIGGGQRAAEERYRVLVESVKDYAIFLLDTDGHVESWNQGARRIKGYEEDEIVGHHVERFYTPEARAAGLPAKLLARAAEEGRVEDVGWRVRKDGTRFWADVVITALRDEHGRLTGFAKVTRDLGELSPAATRG